LVRLTPAILCGLLLVFLTTPARAGIGLYNVGAKFGLDVVQANDTRRTLVVQADIASLFGPKVRLELAGEVGHGTDLDGTGIRVLGWGAMARYLWANEKQNAFAYTGLGVGVSRFRRESLYSTAYLYQNDLMLHFVLVGMEKHVFHRRVKGIAELRWVLGDMEDASALRAAVGLGFILRKPWGRETSPAQ